MLKLKGINSRDILCKKVPRDLFSVNRHIDMKIWKLTNHTRYMFIMNTVILLKDTYTDMETRR